jgi:phosphate transport system protein
MERRFEGELKNLKSRILEMGGFVEQAIEKATLALDERNLLRLDEIRGLENKINDAHIAIDNLCLELLARQSPVAADLRLILAIIKINTDLERMGDQAVNISYNTEDYLARPKVEQQVNLPQMASLVKVMVRHSLDAFMREDTTLAQNVLESDDEVDEFKNRVFSQLIPYMQQCPDKIEAALDLILIARNLERMADHATNIAEDVIFASTGEDVRHGLGHIS